ncbi:MAG: hypothetical protein LBR79_01465 [Oscillospiraceae bacterium]|nr:hypothetical protein [Oscillospiraceae bacterium]
MVLFEFLSPAFGGGTTKKVFIIHINTNFNYKCQFVSVSFPRQRRGKEQKISLFKKVFTISTNLTHNQPVMGKARVL